MSFRWNRRAFLRGAGTVAVGLPFLSGLNEAMPARAQAEAFPKRLVVFFTPNGFNEPAWPTSTNLAGTSLEALSRHASKIIVTRGLRMESAYQDSLGDGSHYNGWAHMLTADYATFDGSPNGDLMAGAQSFDMLLADRIGASTPFKYSLQGVNPELAMSWLGHGQPAAADGDPRRVFDRLFADFEAPPDEVAAIRARRHSVLDYAMGSMSRLNCRLGADDRRRLDAHLTAVRDVESRLAIGARLSCSTPLAPGSGLDYPETGRAQMDLLASSLACDLTRVGSLQWTRCVSGGTPTWIGIDEDHHELSHDATDAGQDKVKRINAWYAEQLAYFLDRLASYEEGEGETLLDHTAVVWVSELGLNVTEHTREHLGVVIAGGGGGTLRGGQYLDLAGKPHSNLWVELINALSPPGAPELTSFGNPEACTGGLPEVRT